MKRRKNGFTLTEMLTVVGILAILMAVAIPAIITLQRDLKMRELDDTAREIFLAAQNSLTARKAAGTPMELGDKAAENNGCYWLSSSDPDAKKLLPAGSIEGFAAGHSYIIWFNAETGTVLEVYYGESTLPVNKIKTFEFSDTYTSTHKAERREAKIGYYKGDDITQGDVVSLTPPLVKIENGETLSAIIEVPNWGQYAAEGVKLTVTVDALDGRGGSYTFPEDMTKYSPTTGEVTLILDSLNDGQHFKDICKNITPGANIRVTATLSGPETADGKIYLPSSASAETNSLFADREGDTVSIACGRHLQNLEPTVSGLPDSGNTYYAVQTNEITWSSETLFQPICNKSLRGYDGKNNEIKKLNVDCDNVGKVEFENSASDGDSGAGLFAYVTEATLQNIRLVDPALTTNSSQAEHVGALAGILRASTVSNCQVYGKEAKIECQGNAGGLIGLALDGYKIIGSSASLPKISSTEYAGGLIGFVSTHSGSTDGEVTGCYADIGMMGDNKKWNPEYGISGNKIGGLVGGAWVYSGCNNKITDCYALGYYSGTGGTLVGDKQNYSVNISNCYNIMQSDSGNSYYKNDTPITSLSELNMTGDNWTTGGATVAYNTAVCTGKYPYPMLKLNHYGDWQVQLVDGIKLYDSADPGEEIHYIMVPAGTETASFDAAAMNGNENAMQMVTATGQGDGITNAVTAYDSNTGRTNVTLTLTLDKNPCVTYVDLTADEYTLRAVVIIYEATVTLNGTNDGNGTTARSYASTDGESEVNTLYLSTQAKTGEITASLEVTPGNIVEAIKGIAPGADSKTVLSATGEESEFDNWDKIKDGDPWVKANGNVEVGGNILAPLNGEGSTPIAENGTLKFKGVTSGTATVIARWAMDESLEAECEVKMTGARALIYSVVAKGNNNRTLGEKYDYPYRLDLTAEPKEPITLTFTPKVFGKEEGEAEKYEWKITKKGDATYSKEGNGAENGVWTTELGDNSSYAEYTVTLTYTNGEEKSVDYMTFTVYRAARKMPTNYESIVIKPENPEEGYMYGTFSGLKASVEQIESTEYPCVNELTLQGYVEGAANTQVQWSYSIGEGKKWIPVTGQDGAISVFQEMEDGVKRMRATLEWQYDNQYYEEFATGGAIKIVGVDANEYDEDFTFRLRAEAVEATNTDGADAAYKEITVTVMKRLQIEPNTYVGYTERNINLNANRENDKLSYQWSIDDNSGTTFPNSASGKSITFTMNQEVERHITLRYGPHTAYATVKAVGSVWDALATINWDMQVGDTDYFLVEKGATRTLNYSWFVGSLAKLYRARTTAEPENNTLKNVSISSGNGTALNELVTNGNIRYSITGKEFGEENISWTYQHGTINIFTNDLIWPFSEQYYSYETTMVVVGMDIKQGETVVSDEGKVIIENLEDTVALTADWSFPENLRDGEPKITWTISDSDLVTFDGGSIVDGKAITTGENVTLIAHKYSAEGYTVTLEAKCEVTATNGREYTFTKLMEVIVKPQGDMTVTINHCDASDLSELKTLFDADLTSDSVLVPTDENGPVLVEDRVFGCNVAYFKATIGNTAQKPNLESYFLNIYTNDFYAKVTSELSTDKETVYIRVEAIESNKDMYELPLHVAIGSAAAEQKIELYNAPTVELTLPNGTPDGEDVTNESVSIGAGDPVNITLTATLNPTLYSSSDRTIPLDTIQWYMETAAGYVPERYLNTSIIGDTITVTLKDPTRMPDFRVVIHARSGKEPENDDGNYITESGYALVFLPPNETTTP